MNAVLTHTWSFYPLFKVEAIIKCVLAFIWSLLCMQYENLYWFCYGLKNNIA